MNFKSNIKKRWTHVSIICFFLYSNWIALLSSIACGCFSCASNCDSMRNSQLLSEYLMSTFWLSTGFLLCNIKNMKQKSISCIFFVNKSVLNPFFRSPWFRSLSMRKHLINYFPVDLVKTADLTPDRNYLLCMFPRGIMVYELNQYLQTKTDSHFSKIDNTQNGYFFDFSSFSGLGQLATSQQAIQNDQHYFRACDHE